MERYEELELDIIRFDLDDIITASGDETEDYVGPDVPV